MRIDQIYKNLALSSLGAAFALLCILLVSLLSSSHITQQHFEILSNVETYTDEIKTYSNHLRLILSFDNVFIVFYTASFTFLFMALSYSGRTANLTIGFVAILATGLLDFYENHHIMTFITMTENGVALNIDEVASQMTLSQLKFHLSYLSFFLFAFSMPSQTFVEKFLKYSLLFLQLPIGVLVYTVPASIKPLFEVMRYINMLSGLFLIAYIFYTKSKKDMF